MEYRVKNPPEAGWEKIEAKREAFHDRLVDSSIMPLVVGQGIDWTHIRSLTSVPGNVYEERK